MADSKVLTDLRSSKLSQPRLPCDALLLLWSACSDPGNWKSSTEPSEDPRMMAAHVQGGTEERNLHLKWVTRPVIFITLAEWPLQCLPQPRSAKHSSREVYVLTHLVNA